MAKAGRTVRGVARLLAEEERELLRLRKRRERLASDLKALAGQLAELRGKTGAGPRAGLAKPKKKRGRKRGRGGAGGMARRCARLWRTYSGGPASQCAHPR